MEICPPVPPYDDDFRFSDIVIMVLAVLLIVAIMGVAVFIANETEVTRSAWSVEQRQPGHLV